MDWSDFMQKIYNFYNCFDTIQGRLYRQNSPSGIELTASASTQLVPASLSGNGHSVFATFNGQNVIPFPAGTTVSLSGLTSYSGTYSVTTASITGGVATIGWSSSITGAASITTSTLIKFQPENKIILSSVATLTAGMSVVASGLTASVTISSISSSINMITLSQNNLEGIIAGQYLYFGRNTLINTNTPLDCLNVYKRKVVSSGLTGDPTTDTIVQIQKSFEEALAQSPSSEEVEIIEDPTKQRRLALITENTNPKWNEDIKNISIPFSNQMDVGKTVDWIRTGYKYLVMTQNLTQKAYFSGTIHQCNFLLKWKDSNNVVYSQYVVVNGPGEKDSDYFRRDSIMIDRPSWSIEIFIGKTSATQHLLRYNRVILNGVSWEIVVINNMENESILRIALVENYINNNVDNVSESLADNSNENVAELQSLILNDLS